MAGLRASDADRERMVRELRRHHEDGRITTEELEERIGAVWHATFESDLAALTVDLPVPGQRTAPPGVAGASGRRPPRWPGRLGFAVRWRAPAAPHEAMADLLEYVAPPLRTNGYDLVERSRDRAVFARTRTPLWVVPIIVLTFPFGLLALLIRTSDRITVELVPEGADATLLYAHGTAPLAARRAFALLEA